MTALTELADTLTWLVDTPSETGAEGRICTQIAERLMPVWGRDAVQRIGNNLVVGRRSGKPIIVLVGHLDTVPKQGQGPARVEDGRLVGLGASDMKAGIAVMVHLLELESIRDGSYDVVGVFYEREEGPAADNGLVQVLEAMDWIPQSVFAIVLEPTGLAIQLGCLGTINARVAFLGSAAHSARPWLGENAVTKAGEWLARMDELDPKPVTVAGLEFQEVVSVTAAVAGVASNVIPARFELNVNYRYPPSVEPDQAEVRLEELLKGVDEFEVVDRAPPASVPEGDSNLDRLVEISGAAVEAKQAWTDVARFAALGVPAVNYGPGDAELAHRPDESASLDKLDEAFAVLSGFLTA